MIHELIALPVTRGSTAEGFVFSARAVSRGITAGRLAVTDDWATDIGLGDGIVEIKGGLGIGLGAGIVEIKGGFHCVLPKDRL